MEFDFQITEHVAELSRNKRNGTLEINKTKRAGYQEKWDLRRWYIDENGEKKMGKGVSMSNQEMQELIAVMAERF